MEGGVALPGTPALSVTGLSKRFGASIALREVSLDIGPGEVRALVGENGSGKSTLIKILSGFHRPDAGAVMIGGVPLSPGHPAASYQLGARFVHQDLGLVDGSPVLDNLAIGAGYATRLGTISVRRSARRARADLARVGLDVDPQASVGDLAPAARTGVAIARALREDAAAPVRLLVLDEPTATLPEAETGRLMEIVRRVAGTGVGVLYVTHRLEEVFALAAAVTVLRDGRDVATRPTTALDRGRLVDLLVGEELTVARHSAEVLPAEAGRSALSLLDVTAVSLHGFSAEIQAGQITGIAGITGSGRETVLGAVFGAIARQGEVRAGDGRLIQPGRPDLAIRSGLAYLPADRARNSAIGSLPARENIALTSLRPFARLGTMRRGPERQAALGWFERLDVRPPGQVDLLLEAFSGGNQQKIMMAKWLRREPAVFLLDEPTQGVDVAAKAVLHGQLVQAAAAGAAVVVSSSDADELAAICQRVLVCRDGRVGADLRGRQVTVRAISRECLLGSGTPADNGRKQAPLTDNSKKWSAGSERFAGSERSAGETERAAEMTERQLEAGQ